DGILERRALHGTGITELADYLRKTARRPDAASLRRRERHFLSRAVAERFGRFGVDELERVLAAWPDRGRHASYEELEAAALQAIRGRIRPRGAGGEPGLRLFDYPAAGNGYQDRLLLD